MTVRQVIRASLSLLTPRGRRLLGLSMLVQTATTLLDLLGVVLIGALGTVAVGTLADLPTSPRLASVVSAFGLGSLSQPRLIVLIASTASLLLLAKSLASPLLMARVYRFLAHQQVDVSDRLTRALLDRPLTFVQRRSTQETSAALVNAANVAIMGVLGNLVMAAGDATLLLALSAVLLVANAALALGAIAFFGLLGFGLQRVLGHRAARAEAARITADIDSLRTVQEAVGAYREITVANRRSFYASRIRPLRGRATRAAADQQLIAILPKYVSEGALVLGAFILAAVLFSTRPVGVAAGTFALFLAAGTRVLPSLLRLQGALLLIRGAAGSASRTYALADELGATVAPIRPESDPHGVPSGSYPDFQPAITLRNVSFTYPGSELPVVRDISLSINAGQSVALVGRSGAGKSTLADLILGVLDQDSGAVVVGGVSPAEAIRRWPGGIAYVPQEVMHTNDTIRSNVALGLPRDLIDDDLVWEALRRAHLAEVVARQPDGLDTQIGERGLRLSGGQRQRLGLARALFTRPLLLVLDEATSSLDAETEQAISATLNELDDGVTTVTVAHRLSTVRHADVVVYLEEGCSIATGTFDEVCVRVPALQRQADLMGLSPG